MDDRWMDGWMQDAVTPSGCDELAVRSQFRSMLLGFDLRPLRRRGGHGRDGDPPKAREAAAAGTTICLSTPLAATGILASAAEQKELETAKIAGLGRGDRHGPSSLNSPKCRLFFLSASDSELVLYVHSNCQPAVSQHPLRIPPAASSLARLARLARSGR
jgi:hypothetical protein